MFLRKLVTIFGAYGRHHQPLYAVSLMLLFWALFDGTASFITPLVITQNGFSKTLMGIIIGSSSVAGALFDFFLSKYLVNTHFRRVYFALLAICSIYPLVLWQAKTVWVYLVAMALWGLYYDFSNFGTFDFVSRKTQKSEHSASFGVLLVFRSLGYMLAPLIVGFVISTTVDSKPFLLMWVYLLLAITCYIVLLYAQKRHRAHFIDEKTIKPKSMLFEFSLWKHLGRQMLPILMLTTLLNIFDAFFWTLGPLVSESYQSIHPFNGLFMTAYSFPPLVIGWFVGRITGKIGKKRTSFIAFFIGSLFLVSFAFLQNPILIIAIIFLSSCISSLAWPSLNGEYADYVIRVPKVQREIQSIEDFFTNAGYIVGPVIAGILADRVGNMHAFAYLGFFSAIISLLLFKMTPKKIIIRV